MFRETEEARRQSPGKERVIKSPYVYSLLKLLLKTKMNT